MPVNDRLLPAIVAAVLGAVLALVLLVPYVGVQYRRRGTLGPGRVLLSFATLVYALALVAYVLLPLPEVGPDFCRVHGVDPQLRPFQFVADIIREGAGSPSALVTNAAVLGVAFNVMLFIPFGALFRHLSGRGIAITTFAGATTSLLVELTQLTGVWSLFPCAYRLFDIDDLITNTIGALIGATVVEPLLRSLPGQPAEGSPEAPRPLTTGRRLLGMLCDCLTVILTGATLNALARVGAQTLEVPYNVDLSRLLFWLVPALGQLALIWWTGATLGEHSVRVRPAAPGGNPRPPAKLIRWALGIGGFSLLNLPGTGIASLLALLLAVAHVAATVFTRGHRGLAYAVAGLDLIDARSPRPSASEPTARQ